jgi:hypothetical protein
MVTASLAVALINRVVTVKELIGSIIRGAEDILTSGQGVLAQFNLGSPTGAISLK